ncbi:hypothetical protein [Chlamydiifrater phoenicopteri]|uniref:hypothetical protein n=1 Tax=Chlamydiifrater phoenicopteri TaxID=2681469 RepID=UPI001BD11174|nr:hypothetical protein [Chlamydiifrater phoenicopteri]
MKIYGPQKPVDSDFSPTEKPSSTQSAQSFTAKKVNTLGYIILTVLAIALAASIVAMILTKDIAFTIVQSILGVMIASVISIIRTPSSGNLSTKAL